MHEPLDFDEILRQEAVDAARETDHGSVGKMSAEQFARLEAEFYYALRNDIQLGVDLARAAAAAAAHRDELQEQARIAADPATPPEEAERLRASLDRWKRRREAAYAAIGQPVPDESQSVATPKV